MARSGLDPESASNEMIVDDDARGVMIGTLAVRPGMFDGGLATAVDTLARTAFYAGLAAAQLDPPIRDPEAFYGGLIRGIQETDRVMRRQQAHAFPATDGELDPRLIRQRSNLVSDMEVNATGRDQASEQARPSINATANSR